MENLDTLEPSVTMQFTREDLSELYHIIRSRGFCRTRSKLVEIVAQLDFELAQRINEEDEQNQ